jgi:hypothetical protein
MDRFFIVLQPDSNLLNGSYRKTMFYICKETVSRIKILDFPRRHQVHNRVIINCEIFLCVFVGHLFYTTSFLLL